MKKIYILSQTIVAVFILSGCVTFLDFKPQEKLPNEIKNLSKKTLTFSYSQFQNIEKKIEKSPEKDRLLSQKRILNILNATNQFNEIKILENENIQINSDLLIKFSASSNVNNQSTFIGTIFKLFSFVTLTLIPMEVDQKTIFTAEVFDKNGKRLKLVENSFQAQTWIGWIFIPFMPFYSPNSQADKAFENMINATLLELKKDGIL